MAKSSGTKTNAALLILDHITVRESGRTAFPNTGWVWRRGEQWGILGPNGSGKSLFALVLAGQWPLLREVSCSWD